VGFKGIPVLDPAFLRLTGKRDRASTSCVDYLVLSFHTDEIRKLIAACLLQHDFLGF
jgi:hypothetical protein